jgi:anaerobic ribonucleoside-triphosphate reductase activating protein
MIRISHIEARSFVDGPGERAVLFVQGCPIECPGCQNKHLWPASGGRMENEIEVALSLAQLAINHGNVTISGGDPFAQPASLLRLLQNLREFASVKHIIVYTGFLWEHLINYHNILKLIDVLVDGPFIRSEDDTLITYRGSRNQRPIDVQASLAAGEVVVLDWDNPEIVIDTDGTAFLPVGLVEEFKEIGDISKTRRCGQTK